MLRELHIENFALIQKLTVPFGDGLNILTGETGAGKSIIIDALNQVLGERASSELVRSGEEKASVTAVVDVDPNLLARLAELGLETREGSVILQREIYANGKSQARIDGRPVNLAVLREIGSMLVEIHGQHEHQALLDENAHLSMVDAYGGAELQAASSEYQLAWQELSSLKKEIAGLHGDQRERERLLDLLQYQVDEIEQAALTPGEEESLLAEQKLLQNARKLLEVCHSSYQALYEAESRNPVIEILASVVASLKDFRELDGTLEQACTQLEESLYSVEDAAQQLRSFAEGFSYNPERLNEVEERLELIYDLKRKYADSVGGILAWRDEKSAEIERIRNTEARHAQLTEMIAAAAAKAGKLALALSALRQQAGRDLAEAIVGELAYLQMANTRFQVEFAVCNSEEGLPVEGRRLAASATGIDDVRFLISPNPGEPLKPLSKIASGGEMSRIMLAILNVLAKLRPVHTMIFDEIDAGIGGRAAQAVAEKLAAVAARRQVICVSHLPQVSSMADTHLYIYKEQGGERTLTKVTRLDMEGRVEELARMLGGAEVTPATIEHAREMLSMASKAKLGD
ncbi:MAG: DNA repair protein RecN [Eubacteriales bacterium]|nr:DNA repair protein RecN [Eubacteriales bacterium]MDD4078892.1 DNA repair protein RecN [Eubacteriales bacterium]